MTPQPPQGPTGPSPLDALQHENQQPDPIDKPVARQQFKQILVSEQEKQRLKDRIYHDFLGARSDHDARINRFRRYYRLWRGLVETRGNRQDGKDLQVPLLKWTVFGQWAKCMQALLGEDAEIIAKPTGPADEKDSAKAGKYMTWRVFEYMRATIALAVWIFRAILFGRAHAEIIYEQEYYWQRDDEEDINFEQLEAAGLDVEKVREGVWDHEVLAYDGPKLRALWPNQLIVPAQDNVNNVDEFEWKIRRDRLTPQQLLDGERRGKYQGVRDHWTEISSAAQMRQERDWWWDDEKIDADEAEGVDHTNTLGNRDSVEVWRWFGKWRLPKGKRDSRPENINYREVNQSELLVTYLPKVGIIIGIQDLRDVYPRMRKRSPFVDLSTVKDGSYWAPGYGELLEDIQDETSINHMLFRKAGMLSVGPLIFFNPAGGFDPDTFEYRPGTAIPTQDPNSVKAVTFQANLEFSQEMANTLRGYGERLTGLSDQGLGKSADEPNAPRTASGQAMLLNEGNVRATLDMTMLREDFSNAIDYIWALDREYADEQVFFRVTDEDAVNFDVNKGFGTMTAEEREHPMSFDLKFATSVYSKEAKKQYMLQLYQISMANPVVQTNPRALWVILNRVWELFGEGNFKDIIPEPPSPENPKMPKDEWSEMLRGEIVHVSALDDDYQHMLDHRRRLQAEMQEPPERRSQELENLAQSHIAEHERQLQQKQLLQQLAMKAFQLMQMQGQGQPQGPQPQAFPAPAPPAAAPAIAPPPVSAAAPQAAPQGPVAPAAQQVAQQ